ncbi:AzlC family ABC transporter permease [Campylobacter canadensis]|uniref:AzlC family ABC transporter permease n=1 Tax=Campylobacter canadensis TaxID=449520 RepID=A0ABS7WTV4_9BACT|nr:AzlC family ABC transporter permease [Campylobacter canadensis]MBZ7987732.1 AzlC family ABC transporter permease [Campylobacter canadensis]MBZ7994139.1 AzlC family ABC transporter permease [Campylobacter canadensis]MBZ7995858.1 AzlC family ABC transporter permease [Campylobacter canadensis]MBZ7997495.1 AzlC family ABC transporter permease [Campylobacter canadensis]MBZ7999470.1 AzlC family ABC transporter permease [Campylobacter canadensis]
MIKNIKIALIDTFGVLIAYVVMGIAFGILAYSNSFSFIEVLFSAVFVFSGSLQFLLLNLLANNAGIFEILLACILINTRHFFYVLGTLNYFKTMGFIKFYAIFALTDESFAILGSKQYSKQIALLILFFNHLYWISGCVLGYLLASVLKSDYSALSFSLNALFIVLAYELYIKNKEKLVFLIAIVISFLGLIFIDKDLMILSCIFSALIILLIGKKLCLIR